MIWSHVALFFVRWPQPGPTRATGRQRWEDEGLHKRKLCGCKEPVSPSFSVLFQFFVFTRRLISVYWISQSFILFYSQSPYHFSLCLLKPMSAHHLHNFDLFIRHADIAGTCIALGYSYHCTIKISFRVSSCFVKGKGDKKPSDCLMTFLESQPIGYKNVWVLQYESCHSCEGY